MLDRRNELPSESAAQSASLIASFLRDQERIYKSFETSEALTSKGTSITPFVRSPKAGYLISLGYHQQTTQMISDLSAAASRVIPLISYSSATVHTTLVRLPIIDLKSFRPDEEKLGRYAERVREVVASLSDKKVEIGFQRWLANSDTIILAGSPQGEALVRLATALEVAVKELEPSARILSMAHITAARFLAARSPELLHPLISLLEAFPVPARAKVVSIDIGHFECGPAEFRYWKHSSVPLSS